MKPPVYLVVGVPSSGKSWVCEQLREKFEYVRHDDHQDGGYVDAILADRGEKPVLCETPFSISQIMEPLLAAGRKVIPVFVIEEPQVLIDRYQRRQEEKGTPPENQKPIPSGHLTRQKTYADRARAHSAFAGTSAQVLEHLRAA